MKNLSEMSSELVFLHRIGRMFKITNVNILNIVLSDNRKRGLPTGRAVKSFDVILPRAQIGAGASPLRFVIGPIE